MHLQRVYKRTLWASIRSGIPKLRIALIGLDRNQQKNSLIRAHQRFDGARTRCRPSRSMAGCFATDCLAQKGGIGQFHRSRRTGLLGMFDASVASCLRPMKGLFAFLPNRIHVGRHFSIHVEQIKMVSAILVVSIVGIIGLARISGKAGLFTGSHICLEIIS